MPKEIGSEFEFNFEKIMSNEVDDLNELFPYSNYQLVGSGRSGVKQILLNVLNKKHKYNQEFLLPSYLCPSIVQAYKELGLNILYYNVNGDLSIDLEDLNSKINERTKAVYFINYFGVLQPTRVISFLLDLKSKGITVIEDITHNYFSKRHDIGDYLVGSLRKWGPLPLGGIVVIKKDAVNFNTYYEKSINTFQIKQLKSFGQQLKYLYLNEIEVEELKNTYLRIFNISNEALYSSADITPMDELSLNIFRRMEISKLKQQRRNNYQFLYDRLQGLNDINILLGNIEDNITPLGFHITLENRDEFRRYLIKNNVYASVHWELPDEVQTQYNVPKEISKKILTIPCDQRYCEEDMEMVVDLIRIYFDT